MVQYHPQLKKRDEEFPVSDLKFVSKLIEKPVVAWQLNDRILDRDVDKNNSGIFFFWYIFFYLIYLPPLILSAMASYCQGCLLVSK